MKKQMTLQEAIINLKLHQKWRLGADMVMIEPKELTESIDILLKHIEFSYTEEQVREELISFQIYLNTNNLITNHDWDFEKIAKKYMKSLKQHKQ